MCCLRGRLGRIQRLRLGEVGRRGSISLKVLLCCGALVGFAFIMSSEYGLGKAMSWFSNGFSTVGLYHVWASCFHRFVLTLCPIVKSRTNFNLVYRSIRFQLFLNPIPAQTLFTSLLQTSLSVLMQFAGIGPAQQEYSSSLPSLSFSECVYRKWTESAVVALWVWTAHTATDWGADYGCYFGSTRKPFVFPLPFIYSPS